MKKTNSVSKKEISGKERLLKWFRAVLIAANIIMVFTILAAFSRGDKNVHSDKYLLGYIPASPAYIASAYDSENGIYGSGNYNKQSAACARYINAMLFYYAYLENGDEETAAHYYAIMEENKDGFPAYYMEQITVVVPDNLKQEP